MSKFVLEEKIMNTWCTFDTLLDICYKSTESNDMDKVQNLLLGLKEMSPMLFEDIFKAFEKLDESK